MEGSGRTLRRVTAIQAVAGASVTAVIWRTHGKSAGTRTAIAGATGLAVVNRAAVYLASDGVWEPGHPRLNPGDLLTVGRASAASLAAAVVFSGERDRIGPAGRMVFVMLFPAITVGDWIDGHLARGSGVDSDARLTLDLETDSFTTLLTAAYAVYWAELPGLLLLAPAGRYIPIGVAVASGRYRAASTSNSVPARFAGFLQMAILLAALIPVGSPRLQLWLERMAPPIATISIASLIAQSRSMVSRRLE